MFAKSENADGWEKLRRLYTKEKYVEASDLLRELMPQFREAVDDLRLLFFIGYHASQAAYEETLTYFSHWPTNPPDRYNDRCDAYLYALQNSMPPRVREAKPYLKPLFLQTVGYIPAENTDIAGTESDGGRGL